MQRLALAGSADESGRQDDAAIFGTSIGIYFGIGLLGGGLAGAALLLGAHVFAAGQMSPLGAQVPAAIAGLAHWVPETRPSRLGRPLPIALPDPQPDAFDVVIDRGARASAPLGLRLVGSDDARMEVVLRDVPAAAVLSRGERREGTTWVLKAADLKDLRLTLNDGAPDAFDVRIEVLAPAGFAAASSVARVRLVGSPPPRVKTAVTASVETAPVDASASVDAPAAMTPVSADAQLPIRTVSSDRNDVPKRERVARVSPMAATVVEIERRVPQVAPPQGGEAWHWPEGASGLGAIARESERQVWWTLPAPAWSPFADTAGR